MAGYTSRLFLILTIPSVFGLSVLWFLKKKKPAKSVISKAIQVEDSSSSDDEQFLTVVPMSPCLKYKNKGNTENGNTEMLVETQHSSPSPNANGIQLNGMPKKSSKSKMREKSCTFPKDYILNEDRDQEDNGIDLSNGIEAIDSNTDSATNDECQLLNAINKMEITSSSQNCVHMNGDAKDCSTISDTHSPQNGGSAKEKCDTTTDLQVCCIEERNSDGHENEQQTDNIPSTVKIDSREPLLLPVVSAETTGEMLESPGATYCDSVVKDIAIVNASIEDIPNTPVQSTQKLNGECVNVSNQNIAYPPEQKVTYARVCASSLKKSPPKSLPINRIQGAKCVNGQSRVEATSGQDISVPKLIENGRILGAECTNVSGQSQLEGSSTQKISCVENGIQSPDGMSELFVKKAEDDRVDSGSYDSGKGGSEIHYDGYQSRPPSTYEFEILQEYVGLLIGRNGRHVRYIKEETNADILIKRHPMSDRKKVCAISGNEEDIHAALKLIRKRFPIETYPSVTLSHIGAPLIPSLGLNAENLKLNLPESVVFDVMLSATVNAGHFFLQQPTHPSFHSLVSLNTQMTVWYNEDSAAPSLPDVNTGYICAAKLGDNWFRAEIDEVFADTNECRVKFLDYGGYMVLPRTDLKQIRTDFMYMPFQASECYLGEVTYPEGVTEWSGEATAAFEELAQGQILQGYICGYADNRVPYVKLFKVTGVNWVDINAELVNLGHAKSLLLPGPQEV